MSDRPYLYMLVGVPASGKSTWINTFKPPIGRDTTIISTDSYIEHIALSLNKTYDEVFQEHIKAATKNMYKHVEWAVERGTHIVWDQTNLTRKTRAKKLIMIPDHYIKIAIWFPTPDEAELKRRLSSRPGKTVPWGVMQNMIDSMTYPGFDEGFDVIWNADAYNERIQMYSEMYKNNV